ncbi:conserved Plasmodium protein, unknown function [Babesia microti strain RI]|uniref:Uncharacterized protein n=1 Tax=Babesia microti (strain RI) TaxID=1133968 RepID=I7IQB8_BABMR|nr:conserved Plasmodium protein, unknown function [Babesia microti strain RI]CCF73655.1 conserved Plasmodium protein, unknown function [Babesia microti strain RI]|eukprot:XP_012648264.1 conserved Plasmodium protein, unknown function [Babesia microti strain RI]
MMLQISLARYNVRRLWERSLRRLNKRAKWALWKWMVKGNYKNLKFSEHERIDLIKRQFDPKPMQTIGPKYCDMQALHEQDLMARSQISKY